MPRWTSTARPSAATTTNACGFTFSSTPSIGAVTTCAAGSGSMAMPGPDDRLREHRVGHLGQGHRHARERGNDLKLH